MMQKLALLKAKTLARVRGEAGIMSMQAVLVFVIVVLAIGTSISQVAFAGQTSSLLQRVNMRAQAGAQSVVDRTVLSLNTSGTNKWLNQATFPAQAAKTAFNDPAAGVSSQVVSATMPNTSTKAMVLQIVSTSTSRFGWSRNYTVTLNVTTATNVAQVKDGRVVFDYDQLKTGSRQVIIQYEPGTLKLYSSKATRIQNASTNPSFETDLTGWTGTALVRDTTQAYSGTSSAYFRRLIYTDNTSTKVTPNSPWTVSAYFKSASVAGLYVNPVITFYNSAGAVIGSSVSGPNSATISTTGWTRTSFTFTTPANAASISIEYDASSPSAYLYMDAVMVSPTSLAVVYADGNSSGWAWGGTVNNSSSSGPMILQ